MIILKEYKNNLEILSCSRSKSFLVPGEYCTSLTKAGSHISYKDNNITDKLISVTFTKKSFNSVTTKINPPQFIVRKYRLQTLFIIVFPISICQQTTLWSPLFPTEDLEVISVILSFDIFCNTCRFIQQYISNIFFARQNKSCSQS